MSDRPVPAGSPPRLRLLREWLRSSSRGVGVLVAGVGISQVIAFAGSPVVSRIYDPEAFGELAVFMSVVGILGILGTGRLDLAIPVQKTPREASATCLLGFVLAAAVSLLAFGALAVLVRFRNEAPLMGGAWALVAPAAFATSGWRLLNYWFTAREAYTGISISYIGRAVAILGVQLALALLIAPRAGMLVGGQTVGLLVAFLILLGPTFAQRLRIEWSTLRGPELRAAARRSREFLGFGTAQALTNALSQNAIVFVMAALFTTEALGQVSQAMRLMMFPVYLLADAVRRVVYQQMAATQDRDRRYRIWQTATLGLLPIALALVAVVSAAGPRLFALFLGAEWEPAGQYARILAPPIAVAIIHPPTTMALPLLGLQALHFRFEIALITARVACMVLGARLDGAVGSLLGYAVSSIALNLWLLAYVGRRLRREGGAVDAD